MESHEAALGLDYIGYHARVRPQRRAVVDLRSGESVDYRVLNALVARTAGLLQDRLGEPLGERVALVARNSLDSILLHYACERTGAIFTPLNWRLSAVELQALVADAAPKLIVCEPEFGDLLGPALASCPGVVTLTIDQASNPFRQAVLASPAAQARPAPADAPWTLLYTSGTTGKPKGVIVTRRGALWGSLNLSQMIEVGPGSAMLCDPPLFHTVGLFGIARTALLAGACLALSDRFNPAATLARLSDPALGITHYFGVPQIGMMLLEDPGFAAADLSRLTALVMGGAPMPVRLALAFADRSVPVSNGLGMTETCSIMHMPLDLTKIRERPGHVGFPTPGIETRVVGPGGHDVADGQVGELWLRGPSVTPGYWNQPEATQAAFTDGWFRSGDAVRRDADGAFQIVDRWKDMFISGGENVYPAEIEAVIAALPGVAEVAVVARASEKWGEVGCAIVVVAPGSVLTGADVLAHCSARLAGYKRPASVVFQAALPRTAVGKVRKNVLRAQLDAESDQNGGDHEA